jgi:hypothetical protein
MAQKIETWSSGKRRPNRQGKNRITLDLDPKLYQAIDDVAHQAGNVPLNTTIYRILREWLAGISQVKEKRVIVPIPVPLKRGPKPGAKRARKPTPAPSTGAIADTQTVVDERGGTPTTK